MYVWGRENYPKNLKTFICNQPNNQKDFVGISCCGFAQRSAMSKRDWAICEQIILEFSSLSSNSSSSILKGIWLLPVWVPTDFWL